MHGPLNEIGLVEVLQLLERGGRSGVLRVVGPDPSAQRTLRIDRGQIVALEPDATDAALARALQQRHLAVDDPQAPQLGVEAVATAERDALRERLAIRALDTMLHWTRGRFDFTEGVVALGPLRLAAEAVVVQVVAAESRRADLAAEFDDFQAIPAFAPADEMAAMHPLTLGTLDWRILDAVDGGRSVAAIAAALDEAPEDVAARVRALRGAAILVLQEAPTDVSRSARAAIEAGQYDRAVTLLRGRLATTPGDADAWHALGLAEVGAGRFERAIDAWDAWAAAAPARATEALALRQAARTMLEALQESRD